MYGIHRFFIGLERQLTGHPAGIRINVLICMGTSFFTLFPMLYGSNQVFRVGSSIISGVGFLCSGVIFKDSGTVRGMNTAATLWCTAAIGILASTGMFTMAVSAACSCVSLIFPAQQIWAIQVWYQISVVVCIFLAVTMVKLLIRLRKINRLITRGINERRRKP